MTRLHFICLFIQSICVGLCAGSTAANPDPFAIAAMTTAACLFVVTLVFVSLR